MSDFSDYAMLPEALADLWGAVTQCPNSVACVVGTRNVPLHGAYKLLTEFEFSQSSDGYY